MPRLPFASPIGMALLAAATALALPACQSRDRGVSAPGPADMPYGEAPATQGSIVGTATYRERIRVPDARLHIQLIDNQLADTQAAVIAETRIDNASGPPYRFTLPFDPAKVRDGGRYGLHASLYDGDGRLWFVTDTRTPVTPGQEIAVELTMVRVSAEPGASTLPVDDDAVVHWQCGDLRVASRFEPSPATVQLWWSGRNATLPQAMAASGARYAEAGNEFWTKGDTARLTLAGTEARECTRSDVASPWYEAAQRGVAFRAVGNEPGWWLEVGSGATPTIRAELDYGERTLEATGRVTDGGFAGDAADGTAVTLSIRREPCSDGMSGEAFEAAADLRVGDRTFTGCGAYLQE